MNDLPDMDELIRKGDRSDRSRALQIGLVLVAVGIATYFGSRALFADMLTVFARPTILVGVLFISYGLTRINRRR